MIPAFRTAGAACLALRSSEILGLPRLGRRTPGEDHR